MTGRGAAQAPHVPVLLDEVLTAMAIQPGETAVDGTFGAGGYTRALLRVGAGRVIAFDRDPDAIEAGRSLVPDTNLTLVEERFSQMDRVLGERGIGIVDAITLDIGVSSMQLESPERGFSFRSDGPLDMRMDPTSGETAADLLERLDEDDIANIIYRYGEERKSRRIAKLIVEKRDVGRPVQTTEELADLVERAVGRRGKEKIHPATRTFQAIRIAVNNELGIIEKFITDSVDLIRPNGVLCIITFHSLEDRIVKQTFQRLSGKCLCPPRIPRCVCGSVKKVEIVTRKPLTPTADEIIENPRSRSAKLRVCRKLDN